MIHTQIFTADKLQIQEWDNSETCPLYDVDPETAQHLLMDCPFACLMELHMEEIGPPHAFTIPLR